MKAADRSARRKAFTSSSSRLWCCATRSINGMASPVWGGLIVAVMLVGLLLKGSKHARWSASHHAVWCHVTSDDGARADEGALSNGDAAENDRPGADGGAAANVRRQNGPVGLGLETPGLGGRTRIVVVDEVHVVTDEYLILDR